MDKFTKDEGIIFTLVERFETQRLPRLLEIKQHVDAGDLLSDSDLDFLKQVNKDARNNEYLAIRNPKWQELYAKAIHLHEEIVEKALDNEKSKT